MHSATALALWEDLIADFNLIPLVLVMGVVAFNRVDILAGAVGNPAEHIN